MVLKSFEWTYMLSGWTLNKVDFRPITLVVGPSGVGKTRLLRSILALKAIAYGKAISGVKWNCLFEADDSTQYTWEGQYDSKKALLTTPAEVIDEQFDSNDHDNIKLESLSINGKQVIKRRDNEIFFNGKLTPKFPSHQSAVYVLQEEGIIKPFSLALKSLTIIDQTQNKAKYIPSLDYGYNNLCKRQLSNQEIIKADTSVFGKLCLAYKNKSTLFDAIRDQFVEIFPFVEDIKVEPIEDRNVVSCDVPLLQLKEKGVKKWVHQAYFSSGMFNTLSLLCKLSLSSEGSITLIDEFENSLGVNCINQVSRLILENRRRLQFILTSHHPYIINNINSDSWVVLTRKAGKVTPKSANEIGIGNSKHDSFTQLINFQSDF